MLVHLIMKSLYKEDKRKVKHIGCKRFGIQYILKGIYVHNGLLYFHTEIKNQSNVPFDVDYITFKIVDKQPCAWRASSRNARCSACRSSPSPTASGSWWK